MAWRGVLDYYDGVNDKGSSQYERAGRERVVLLHSFNNSTLGSWDRWDFGSARSHFEGLATKNNLMSVNKLSTDSVNTYNGQVEQ